VFFFPLGMGTLVLIQFHCSASAHVPCINGVFELLHIVHPASLG
jgi:hypothetical protein